VLATNNELIVVAEGNPSKFVPFWIFFLFNLSNIGQPLAFFQLSPGQTSLSVQRATFPVESKKHFNLAALFRQRQQLVDPSLSEIPSFSKRKSVDRHAGHKLSRIRRLHDFFLSSSSCNSVTGSRSLDAGS
jgi:hypothetical protein